MSTIAAANHPRRRHSSGARLRVHLPGDIARVYGASRR
jgi:hypothetical protein